MAKKRRVSPEVAEVLAVYGPKGKYEVSPDLAELLAAYGPPPKMPSYRGDAMDYSLAVNIFVRLTSTPEAVARREALENYFAHKREADPSTPQD